MKPHFLTILLIFLNLGCASLFTESAQNREPADSERLAERLEEARLRAQRQLDYGRKQREIVLGMGMNDVRSVWGEPHDVDSAGSARLGNERWIYYEGASSRWSLAPARTVYFEGGKVVGWQTQ